jgi:nucleoside-diphosphate-sugar epimerase
MKILITGNQGYIGPIVAEQLKRYGATIIGLDTGYFADCANGQFCSPDHFVDLQLNKDVRHISEEDFKGIDHVVYLSAISNDPMGMEFEEVTNDINTFCAVNSAKIAKSVGVKSFVFASSCSVYGAAGDGIVRNESSSLNPVTVYARSKIEAEQKLKPLADKNFKITCLRFATACGFSPRLRLDLVLNDFVASALVNKEINILSDGSPWRPLIHVKDMARAIEWAILRNINGGEYIALNVGDDKWNYQIKELASVVGSLIPGTKVNINKDAAPDKRSYKVSFELFAKLAPNHKPIVTLEEAIMDLSEGIRNYLELKNTFSRNNTIRLAKLRSLIENNLVDINLVWLNK